MAVNREDAARLTVILTELHKSVVLKVIEQRGRPPTKYKGFELHKIRLFFQAYDPSGKPIIDVAAEILSTLLRAHPFPNANHRTLLFMTKALLEANGLRFPHYEKRQPNWEKRYWAACNWYFHRSKYLLRISHDRDELRGRLKAGKRFMYFQAGGKLVLRETDLSLSKKEIAAKHRELTQGWLVELLGGQSDKYRRVSPDVLTRLIAQAER